MRETFSKCLVDHVKENSNAYLLSGDHGYALFDLLRKEMPNHFINAGVAEQNMVGVGAGMSKQGLYPIMYGLSAFVPVRVLEQIKIDFCYENLPGLFIGDGAGVVYSHLGTSHQCTEDIALLRAIPNISILSPCDRHELKACFEWAVRQKSPVYLRMGKADLGDVHAEAIERLPIGEAYSVIKSKKNANIALVATGSMVIVAKNIILNGELNVDAYSFPFIKPLNEKYVCDLIKSYREIFVLEEHSTYGGLGSALCEIGSGTKNFPILHRIGIKDKFSQKCGTYDYLMTEHGLDLNSIQKLIIAAI